MPTPIARIVRGRDSELALLGTLLSDAVAGRGSVVTISGAPGIGKSRLLGEAARIASRLSMNVLGAGAEAQDLRVMSVLLRALGPILEPAVQEPIGSAPGLHLLLVDRLEGALERAALQQPTVIAIDDLQWADADSTEAIAELVTRLSDLPIVWLLASRRQTALAGAVEIRLGALADGCVASIVRDAVGADPGPRLRRLLRGASGNPHGLVELLSGLVEESLVVVDGAAAELLGESLPSRVADDMRIRLDRLSAPARAVVCAAAVIGLRSDVEVVAALLERPAAEVRACTTELIDAGLTTAPDVPAVGGADRFCFAHDLSRDAVLAVIPGARRRTLNRRAVDVFLSRGATATEVAPRLLASARAGDRAAPDLLLEAARALAGADPDTAADLACRGFRIAGEEHPSRVTLACEATLLLHAANRASEAAAFAAGTLDAALTDTERGELLLSVAFLWGIDIEHQLAASREALALDLPDELRARHLARLTVRAFTSGRTDVAEAHIGAARAAATTVLSPRVHHDLAFAEIGVLWGQGRFREVLTETDAAIERAREDPVQLNLWAHWRAEILHSLDLTDAGLQLIAQRSAAAQRAGELWDVRLSEQKRGRHLTHVGRLPEAIATLEGLYARGGGEMSPGDVIAVSALGRAALHAGETELVDEVRRELPRLLRSPTPEWRSQGAFLALQIALVERDRDGVLAALDVLAPASELALPVVFGDCASGVTIVRAALLCDRIDVARRAIAWQSHLSVMNPGVASLHGALMHATALLSGDRFEAAVGALATSPRPLLRASALEDLGGAAALNEALSLYVAAGARLDERRVRHRLRALGVRLPPRPVHQPGSLAGLTDSEAEVARLIARGLTNREVAARLYISPHTVNTHLRHVFTKLGIRSRHELVGVTGAGVRRDGDWELLTRAERRVVMAVSDGMSNRAVAEQLGLSPNTVASHLRRAFRKIGVQTRTELAGVRWSAAVAPEPECASDPDSPIRAM